MQWLIDIIAARVISTIGVPPCFVDRGDPDRTDLMIYPPTIDDFWHDWDLSAIVPAAASAVLIRCIGITLLPSSGFSLRTNGNVGLNNMNLMYSQVVGVNVADSAIVALKADLTVQYMAPPASYAFIALVIAGWWL